MTAREKFLRARLAIWQGRLERARAHEKKYLAEIEKKRRQIAALPQPARGIDVSKFQGFVDFDRVKAAGYAFVWVKATEGQSFRDSNFLSNVRRAKAAGLKVGAYHFLRPRADRPASAEMADFHAALQEAGLGTGDLRPVVDVEATTLNQLKTVQYAREALMDLRRRTGIRPMFYTFPSFNGGVWGSDFNNLAMLWIAHYTTASSPAKLSPWPKYHAWQFTDKGSVPGVTGNCDVNRTPDLKALIA